jgi:hypothetical protein
MSSAGVSSWTLTPADNTTINGISIAENCPAANINNSIRQMMSSVMQELVYQGADISASVSMSLAGVDYRFLAVTSSASIIHVGTGRAGLVRNVLWNSPSTLVNSANIICDGAANIVTATNDVTMFTSLGAGAWRAVHFPISGQISTGQIADLAVTTAKIAANAVTFAKMQAITDGHLLGASGGTAVEEISIGAGLSLSSNVLSSTVTGTIVNRYYAAYTTNADLTPNIPLDNTVPLVSEGTQVLSINAVTTTATQRLRVRFQAQGGITTTRTAIHAIFQDSTCIQAKVSGGTEAANYLTDLESEIEVAPGAAATYAISVRCGVDVSGNMRLNGTNAARLLGGASAATLVIDVIEP